MLSLKHHALYWVISFLTLPLTAIRKSLAEHGLISDIVDDFEYSLVGLMLYFLSRWVLNLRDMAKRETENKVTFSGLVTPTQLEKPEEKPIVDAEKSNGTATKANGKVNRNGKANGNGKNNSNRNNARRRLARSQKMAREQNRNSSNQNGNARPNRDMMPNPPSQQEINKISARRLRKPSTDTGWEESIRRGLDTSVHSCETAWT
ncbi:hypothetical protein FLONG3_2167 [Fusarium longipes]|uniref:Uncharacterized protein n=1 Tax=Fusarium longipes TaxID=694270 RepID=A0A395T4Q6_9HYPO|nr:hypothetical protein FLONG3_2167 [Fusarium longipes]